MFESLRGRESEFAVFPKLVGAQNCLLPKLQGDFAVDHTPGKAGSTKLGGKLSIPVKSSVGNKPHA